MDLNLTTDPMARELLREAYQYGALNSDDPSTQNGSVLIDEHGSIIAMGCNHLPRGVRATPDRLERKVGETNVKKYSFIDHAETDAIFTAARDRARIEGGTLYQPWFACAGCARAIIAVGIERCVGHKQAREKIHPNWMQSIEWGDEMLDEAGVVREYFDGPIGECKTLFNYEIWHP